MNTPNLPISATGLARYDAARTALAECERVDEAKDLSDKAAALAAYAKQARDPELEDIARRIRARAVWRMGELSAALERHDSGHHEPVISGDQRFKNEVLREAGISHGVASRAERIAAMPEEEFERLVEAPAAPTLDSLLRAATGKTAPHIGENSGENEWYTPAAIIEAARNVMGGIDLDPATSEIAQRTVQAAACYTREDDGLVREWHGRIWLNPPYEKGLIDKFVMKIIHEYGSERLTQACVLVNNATETGWGQTLLANSNSVCFLAKRVRFLSPDGEKGAPLQGQMLAGINVDADDFRAEFETLGVVFHV